MFPHPIILAGGIGERCKPITDFRPKCLIPINGKPILQLQIQQLIELGFKKVTILLGKYDEYIKEYLAFKNFNIEIESISTPIHFSSSQRLNHYLINQAIEIKNFNDLLIIYCDNYLENKYIKKVIDTEDNLFFLQKRISGNIKVADSWAFYKSKNRSKDLPYVELGYFKISKHLLIDSLKDFDDLPEFLISVSSTKLFKWIEVDNYESLTSFEKVLEKYRYSKLLLLDRDGVITVKPKHRTYLTDINKIYYLESNLKGLEILSKNNFLFVVCTNQPAVGLNLISSGDLQKIHQRICLDLIKRDIHILDFLACEHTWDDNCECRKPKPGLLNLAINRYGDFKNQSEYIYVGDQLTDEQAASAAGIRSISVGPELLKNSFSDIKSATSRILNKLDD